MTINEIAQMAGVSRATVSRYLNDGYVSDEKRERIAAVIRKTGYTPSVSAQLLRSHHTNFIGVIIPKLNSDSISRMADGISRKLAKEGYQLLLACTENDEKKELKYLSLFQDNNVDGIILFGTIFTPEHRKLLKALDVPVVILAQHETGFSCIYSDDYTAAHELGTHLAKTAHEIGMISVTPSDDAVGRNRRDGFLDAFRENGLSVPKSHIAISGFDATSGEKAALSLLKKYPSIDTLVCVTDTIASGASRAIRTLGLSIPDDIQLSGFGDSTISTVLYPSLTTVHLYYDKAGESAASLLLNHIKEPDTPVNEIKYSFDLKIRESTRKKEADR